MFGQSCSEERSKKQSVIIYINEIAISIFCGEPHNNKLLKKNFLFITKMNIKK